MSSEKLTKLETFIERHRPDFDVHTPSPDLWARLEEQLGQPGPGVGPVLLADEAQHPAPEVNLFPTAASTTPIIAAMATAGRPRWPWERDDEP